MYIFFGNQIKCASRGQLYFFILASTEAVRNMAKAVFTETVFFLPKRRYRLGPTGTVPFGPLFVITTEAEGSGRH